MLTEIEEDFIDFISDRNKESRQATLERYQNTKESINFASKEYREFSEKSYVALAVFFNDNDERSAITAYQYFAYPDILRMLSYSFPKSRTTKGYLNTLVKAIKKGDFTKISSFLGRKIQSSKPVSLSDTLLAEHIAPRIVDYGCGLAYLSFEMACKSPQASVVLVDVDSIKLDFAEYRFKKRGIKCDVIRITTDNPYPSLPRHTICIATDVMEHLHQPLKAYTNIHEAMESGGLLHGDFHDHEPELFHVHPVLADLRGKVALDYEQVQKDVYRKVR